MAATHAVPAGMEANGWFMTTRWSVVLAARGGTAVDSRAALEALCRAYWYPLYAFVRRQGHSPHDAEDLTQEFFARLLEKDYLKVVEREKGKFRTFLLVAIRRFLANEWDRSRAAKRGGGQVMVPIDTQIAETLYLAESASGGGADQLYDRRWALTLVDRAMAHLRGVYLRQGNEREFELLKQYLTAERGGIPYDDIAKQLDVNAGAARVAVHRLRKRFRETFRAEVAQTVSSSDECDEELKHVLTVLGS